MYPTLFRIPAIDLGFYEIKSFPVGSYAVMMTCGFLAAWWFVRQGYARRGYPLRLATDLVIVAALTGLIGARVLSVIENWDIFMLNPVGVLLGSGGLVWYGGVLLAVPSCMYLVWRDGLSVVKVFDVTAPGMSVGYAFGRLGCHLSGDGCYGIPSDLPWAVTYPRGAVPTFVPVHPTPIYEAILAFGLAAYLGWRDTDRRLRPGTLIGLFFLVHGILRFSVEFIRRNDRYWIGDGGLKVIPFEDFLAGTFGLSMSQWISLGMIVAGAVWLWRIRAGGADGGEPGGDDEPADGGEPGGDDEPSDDGEPGGDDEPGGGEHPTS